MKKIFERLYKDDFNSFCNLVSDNLKKENKMFIITVNPEIIMMSENNNDIYDILIDKNTCLVPDGIGVVKASKKLGIEVKERITGIDLATKLFEMANDKHYKIALLGAREEVLKFLINEINKKYSNIEIVLCENGYTHNKDLFFEELNKYRPDICLVALGMPMQEMIIYNHINEFNKGIFIGVGGSFDVLSGIKKRAPEFFIKTNTEWLYRIIKEPKRIKRFYQNNIKFIFKVKKIK